MTSKSTKKNQHPDLWEVEWWDKFRSGIGEKFLKNVTEDDHVKYHLLPLYDFEKINGELKQEFKGKTITYEGNIGSLRELADRRFRSIQSMFENTAAIKTEIETLKNQVIMILDLDVSEINENTAKKILDNKLYQNVPTAIPLQFNPTLTRTRSTSLTPSSPRKI